MVMYNYIVCERHYQESNSLFERVAKTISVYILAWKMRITNLLGTQMLLGLRKYLLQ